jgi:hypothetical protein
MGLQRAEVGGDRWLADEECGGGPRHTAVARDHTKDVERVEVVVRNHKPHLITSLRKIIFA